MGFALKHKLLLEPQRLGERGYNGYILEEQDILPGMGTPNESALRSFAYRRTQ